MRADQENIIGLCGFFCFFFPWFYLKRYHSFVLMHLLIKLTLLTCIAKSISPLMFSAGSMRSKISCIW